MRYEPTPALTFALQRAAGYARRAGADLIAPLHLLLGLLADEEGQPAVLLGGAGVPREALRTQFGLIEGAAAEAGEFALAQETRGVLARARELAAMHSAEGTLSSDQVLVALVAEREDLRERLGAVGLDAARLLGQFDPKPPLVLDEPLDLRPPAEEVDAGRVLDAAANRAREALRVLEDHSRFVLNDALLTGRLKQLRHDLAAALDRLPPGLLLAGRDTTHDVGTGLSTTQEWQRESLSAVIQANGKRLQEALRSLARRASTIAGCWRRARGAQITRDCGALFIVNDRPDIAALAEACTCSQ